MGTGMQALNETGHLVPQDGRCRKNAYRKGNFISCSIFFAYCCRFASVVAQAPWPISGTTPKMTEATSITSDAEIDQISVKRWWSPNSTLHMPTSR